MDQEQLSALMDGELEPGHADRVLRGMRDDSEAVAGWSRYHLIGDILRDEPDVSWAMSSKLAAALAAEPTVLAPRRIERGTGFHRFALPIAASVAGVAVVGWLALSNHNESGSDLPPAAPIGAMAADESVRDLLSVHQEFSPSTAMPGVASYIRTVGMSERTLARQ